LRHKLPIYSGVSDVLTFPFEAHKLVRIQEIKIYDL
jgi:hypothetical protein